jgi:probable phosphoglycerate mutase
MDYPARARTLMSPARPRGPAIPAGLQATLVLVRHGESTFVAEGRFQGQLDPPLSALGERQAAAIASWLARPGGPPGLDLDGHPIEVVHSPLRRAAQSAEPIFTAISGSSERAARSPVLRAEPALTEISQGAWEGRLHAEVAERWGRRLAAWRDRPTTAWAPGGERLSAVQERVRGALPGLLGRLDAPTGHPNPWSIVVAHDGVLRVLLLTVLGLPLARFWAFPFALSSASVVDLGAGRASLRAHNLAGQMGEPATSERQGGSRLDRGGAL